MRLLPALALFLALPVLAESPYRDLRRPPLQRPYKSLVIEWISQEPKNKVTKDGDASGPADGQSLSYTAHLRNLGSVNTEPVMVRWFVDGVQKSTATIPGMGAGQRSTAVFAWTADEGRHWIQCELLGHEEWLTIATDGLTVKVWVEKKTLAKYEDEFGSFARRFQDSVAGLHASWSAVRDARFAPEGIDERLRVDDVAVYERGGKDAEVPKEFWDHPDFDLEVACDQGGPVAGFYIPGYSIGHNYAGNPGHESLFSDWGENCLWHEIGHFRGVQDFYLFPTKAGDVGKLDAAGNPLPLLTLRPEFADDTMNSPYKATWWSEYTTAVIRMKRGVSRVGRCEDPANTFGHMWRHVPAKVEIQVIGEEGKPVKYAEVEVYRPVRGEDGRARVAKDAKPLSEGRVDEVGFFDLGEDPFGKRKAEASRAPWVLVVIKREGAIRARYLTLMDMNLAYWKDQKERAIFRLVWDKE
ncbi:MAG: hypothetical protein FD180_2107 [Planctomycetota bacterium]|nr:MAG: hypothetical protein FD180_2107 [Planctomycetota bacterium]